MNDFLQSLRASAARSNRHSMTRKAYDHDYHSMNQRYHYYSGQLNQQPSNFNSKVPAEQPDVSQKETDTASSSVLLDSIENLAKKVEQLADSQSQLIAVQEKTAQMIERQTVALERIIENIG